MSEERSAEQRAKDLRDAVRAVDNKTLDGIPWYQAEALAAENLHLKDQLTAAKSRLAQFEQAGTEDPEVNEALAEVDGWVGFCQTPRLDAGPVLARALRAAYHEIARLKGVSR